MTNTVKFFKLFKKSIKNLFRYLVGIIVICVGTPLLLFTFAPIVIYRRFLFHSARFFRPDLGKMLNARGHIPAFVNVYKSSRCKIVAAIVIEGIPTVKDIHQGFTSALEATDPKTGDILYPELSQNVKKWMGYWFWKSVPNFNLKDYIHYIDNKETPLTLQEAEKLLKHETSVPFDENKALWKLSLYTNFIPNESDRYFNRESKYSFLVFCVHHSLVDGFSLVKLAHKIFQVTYNDPTIVKQTHESLLQVTSNAIKFFLRFPYDLGKLMLEQTIPKKIWKREAIEDCEKFQMVATPTETEVSRSHMDSVGFIGLASDMIPFERIKDIRKIHNVTSLSVIIAAIAGTIRCNFLDKSSKIPSEIPFSLPFPLHNHPDKLRNHVTGMALLLPVGEKDPIKRLHKINRTLKELKRSTVPFVMALLGVLVGSFPPALLKIFAKHAEQVHVGFLSSFPGPPEEIKVFKNCTWKDNFWVCSVMSGTKVLAFAFTSYGGYGRLLVGADQSVLPSDSKATDVINGFLDQLDVLQQAAKIETI